MAGGGVNIGNAYVAVGLDLTQFSAALARAQQSTQGFAAQLDQQTTLAMKGFADLTATLTQVSTTLAGLTQQQQANTQATNAQAKAVQQQARDAAQVAQLEQRIALARADSAGKVDILKNKLDQLNTGTKAYLQTELQLVQAENRVAREQQAAAQAAAQAQQSRLASLASGVGRGVLQGTGAGSVLAGLGVAGGTALLTRQLIQVGQESVDLATKAQTIGTAYEAATKRAGLSADDLLKKLDAAARGTASDVDLMAASNKALALGVGQNAQQIADLLAIARQKGKDFGEGTTQAFEDITTGLGRLSPRILDNLGIILDENKIYKEYAASIGVASGQLSDQEKRQALVNELLRTNTDLIAKNRDAQLDAADKIAAAQAKIAKAKTEIGTAILPTVGNIAELAGAALGGDLSSAGLKQFDTALADSSKNYQDYLTKRQQAIAKLFIDAAREGDATKAVTAIAQQARAPMDELSVALERQAAQHQRNAAAATVNQAALAKLGGTTIDLAAQTKTVSDALSAAQKNYDRFANAPLAGTRNYEQQLGRLTIAHAQADLSLQEFQKSGGALEQQLAPIRRQIDDETRSTADWENQVKTANAAIWQQQQAVYAAEQSLKPYDDAVRDAEQAVKDQQRVIRDAEQSLRPYDDAIRSAEEAIRGQEGAVRDAEDAEKAYADNVQRIQTEIEFHKDNISDLKDQYDELTGAIKDQQDALDRWRHAPLQGETALDEQIARAELAVKRQQLAIDEMQQGGAGKGQIEAARKRLEQLRNEADILRLQKETTFDEAHRQLENQGVTVNEVSFTDAQTAITNTQAWIDQLQARVPGVQAQLDTEEARLKDAEDRLKAGQAADEERQAAIDAEKTKLDTLKLSLDDIKHARDQQVLAVQAEKDKLDVLNQTLSDAKDARDKQSAAIQIERDKLADLQHQLDVTSHAYDEHKTHLDDLEKQFKKTKDEALKPYEDKLKDIENQTKTLQDQHEISFGAMQLAIDGYKKSSELTEADIINGLTVWGKAVDDLTLKYNLLVDAAGRANAVGVPSGTGSVYNGQPVGGTGAGAYNVQAIDDMLKDTGLEGQGANIARFSAQYRVPAALAIAMFRKESSLLTAGSSVANNNPGNIVYTGGAYGEDRAGGRFGHYPSVEAGVEAYFKLLDREYRRYLDTGNYAGLITKYAPPSENNTAQYIQQITDWIKTIAAAITASGGTGGGTNAMEEAFDRLGLHGETVTQGFNDYETLPNGQRIKHGGLDISGTEGAPIHALQGGRVVKAEYSPIGGNYVEIQNAITGELEEYYGHLQQINVKVGQMVDTGDVIGLLGHTGYATGPHLHLQTYLHGQNVDPLLFFAQLFGTGAGTDAMSAMGTFAQMLAQAGGTAQGVYGSFQTLATLLQFLMQTVTQTGGALTDIAPTIPPIAAGIDQVSAALDGIAKHGDPNGVYGLLFDPRGQTGLTSGFPGTTLGGTGNMSIGGPNVPPLASGVPSDAQDLIDYYKALSAALPPVVVNAGALQGAFHLLGQTYDDLGPKIPPLTDAFGQLGDAAAAASDAVNGAAKGPSPADMTNMLLLGDPRGQTGLTTGPEGGGLLTPKDAADTAANGIATDLGPQIPAIFGKAAGDSVTGFIDAWGKVAPDLTGTVDTSFQQINQMIGQDMVLAQNATEGAVGNILVFVKQAINAIGALNQAIQNVNSVHVGGDTPSYPLPPGGKSGNGGSGGSSGNGGNSGNGSGGNGGNSGNNSGGNNIVQNFYGPADRWDVSDAMRSAGW